MHDAAFADERLQLVARQVQHFGRLFGRDQLGEVFDAAGHGAHPFALERDVVFQLACRLGCLCGANGLVDKARLKCGVAAVIDPEMAHPALDGGPIVEVDAVVEEEAPAIADVQIDSVARHGVAVVEDVGRGTADTDIQSAYRESRR